MVLKESDDGLFAEPIDSRLEPLELDNSLQSYIHTYIHTYIFHLVRTSCLPHFKVSMVPERPTDALEVMRFMCGSVSILLWCGWESFGPAKEHSDRSG